MATIAYYIIYPFLYLLSLLPLRVLYVISDTLYLIIYYIAPYRKKVVLNNLRNSFPEKSQEEITQISKKFYRYFCQLMIEILKLISISEKEIKSRVSFKNPEVLDELHKKGLHAIVITAHYCNWEWFVGITDRTPFHTMSIYKPLSNKRIEGLLNRSRTRFGADVVPMNDTIKALLKYKKEGRQTLSLFISDQSPFVSHIQYWTKFLNQETPVFLGPEKIARKLGQAVIMMKMIETKRGYYEFEILVCGEDVSQMPEYAVTEWHVHELEKMIIEKPQYWLWTHRRWKHKPKHDNV